MMDEVMTHDRCKHLAPRLHLSNVMKEVHWHREIRKYKAHLNAHGGHQIQGVSYWETFDPVVTWTTIQLLLVLILTHGFQQQEKAEGYPCPIKKDTPLRHGWHNT